MRIYTYFFHNETSNANFDVNKSELFYLPAVKVVQVKKCEVSLTRK
jgi:hypothetical protein